MESQSILSFKPEALTYTDMHFGPAGKPSKQEAGVYRSSAVAEADYHPPRGGGSDTHPQKEQLVKLLEENAKHHPPFACKYEGGGFSAIQRVFNSGRVRRITLICMSFSVCRLVNKFSLLLFCPPCLRGGGREVEGGKGGHLHLLQDSLSHA